MHTVNAEQKSVQRLARSHKARLEGVNRNNIHIVPVYTKTHLAKLLETYYKEISIYKRNLEVIQITTSITSEFVKSAKGMNEVFTSTSVDEASVALQSIKRVFNQSCAIQDAMYDKFKESREMLHKAEQEFRKGILLAQIKYVRDTLLSVMSAVKDVTLGIALGDPASLVNGVVSFNNILHSFDVTVFTLGQIVNEIEASIESMKRISNELMNLDASHGFSHDSDIEKLEHVVTLHIHVVEWKNMKNEVNKVLHDPSMGQIDGAAEYSNALLNMTNWGEAMTKAVIEKAEMIRNLVEKKAILDLRLEQKRRSEKVVAQMEKRQTNRERVLVAMKEQANEVAADLNEALLVFCQVYFFENLKKCGSSYRPSFGGNLNQLLHKINRAQRSSLIHATVPSTTTRTIEITNKDNSTDCEDVEVCPITYLRHHGEFLYEVPLVHPQLTDLNQFRVATVVVNVMDAQPKGRSKHLKLIIDADGDFKGRAFNQNFSFLTTPFHRVYETNLLTGEWLTD